MRRLERTGGNGLRGGRRVLAAVWRRLSFSGGGSREAGSTSFRSTPGPECFRDGRDVRDRLFDCGDHVLASVETLSGEIGSGTSQAVATRPVARWELYAG